mgnify:CR=1 FL=1
MILKEDLPIIIHSHPFHQSINDKIVKDSEGAVFHKKVNLRQFLERFTQNQLIRSIIGL